MLKRVSTATPAAVGKCHSLAGELVEVLKSKPEDWRTAAENPSILRNLTALNRDLAAPETAKSSEVQKALRDSHLIPMLVDFAIHVLESGVPFKSTGGIICLNLLNLGLNLTNWSLEFCRYLSQQERFFNVFYRKLLSEQDALELEEDSKSTAIYYSIATVFNAYFKNDSETFSRLSEYELVDCTKPYLKCRSATISTAALILIAFAVDEKQADIFLGAQENITFLIDNLTNALKSPSRNYNGYDAIEAAKCIRRLALNDANKDLLIELDLLPVVQQMLDSSKDEDITEGIEILFTLSFSKRSAPKIWAAFHEAIVKLQASEKWRGSSQLQGLAFQLKPDQPGRPVSGGAASAGKSRRRVMISYNHASRPLVDRLYQKVVQAGLDVWVDFKDMKVGSVYQAMASGIENSSVVLMCITRLYNESSNCRLEVEYAHECGKKLIPLLMEPKYRPSGWLGLLTRAELRYDLTETKGPFDAKVEELLVALRAHLDSASRPSSSSKVGDGHGLPSPVPPKILPAIATTVPVVAASSHHHQLHQQPKQQHPLQTHYFSTALRSWDADRVAAWCRDSQLPDWVQHRRLTGVELQFLVNTLARSPEYFGRLMETHFGCQQLLDLATLVAALEDLMASS